MTLMSVVFNIIKKRPLMCLGILLFVLPFCIFEYLILFPVIYGAWSIGTGNIFEASIYLIQIALSSFAVWGTQFPQNLIAIVVLFIGVLFITALGAGFFYTTNGEVNNRTLGFIDGVKEYFTKINNAFLIFFSVFIAFFFFSIIVFLPSMVLTQAVGGQEVIGLLLKFSLILVDFTTWIVLSYEVVLILVYFSFWIAAIFCFDKGGFTMAKSIIRHNYWELMLKFLFFALTFFGFEILLATINIFFSINTFYEMWRIIIFVFLNVVIKAFLLVSFVTYVFKEFKDKKDSFYMNIYEKG